jgi:hypothetical protein
MLFKPQDRNEPFGAMAMWADGRRTAIPSDFRGAPVSVLATLAERARHPVLRARLADMSWLIDRKRTPLGIAAVVAYVDIIRKVDVGALAWEHSDNPGPLTQTGRDLLRRALQIGRRVGWETPEALATRAMATDLRNRALRERRIMPGVWFSHLDLDFGISDPAEVGDALDRFVAARGRDGDGHEVVEAWRLTARAYRLAKKDEDAHRCQAAAAEQLVLMAEQQQHSAMLASHLLGQAIAELHGIPGKKERRKELRHRLVDAQAGVSEEMSGFSQPLDLKDVAEATEQRFGGRNLRDALFAFAALAVSPDPGDLTRQAVEAIRQYPLSSLFGASHHDREGKVVYRTKGGDFGDGSDSDAVRQQIAQSEIIRRTIIVSGQIEVARQTITLHHFLYEDALAVLFMRSPFVPHDLVTTFSRGIWRFFQGDFTSALYILTPLLENSLRHVLRLRGHEVTIFDDATQTQQDRTISALFAQMRGELDAAFGTAITSDIERLFLSKPGPYLRHAVSHGLLHDGDPYGADAIYGCWLIFHLCMVPLFRIREQLPADLG